MSYSQAAKSRARALRAFARNQRPGSTLKVEYEQRACALDPGHDFQPSQVGWMECQHCHWVVSNPSITQEVLDEHRSLN